MSFEFIKYFDMDKEMIKFHLNESQIKVDEIMSVIELEPLDDVRKDLSIFLEREQEKIKALKLALSSVDENAVISTIDFSGTLDINTVYKGKNKYHFDFSKKRRGSL